MKDFIKKYQILEDLLDIILSLLTGSFALFAIIIVWFIEVIAKSKDN